MQLGDIVEYYPRRGARPRAAIITHKTTETMANVQVILDGPPIADEEDGFSVEESKAWRARRTSVRYFDQGMVMPEEWTSAYIRERNVPPFRRMHTGP